MIAFELWKIGHQHLHSLQNPATANHSHSLGRLLDVFKKHPTQCQCQYNVLYLVYLAADFYYDPKAPVLFSLQGITSAILNPLRYIVS